MNKPIDPDGPEEVAAAEWLLHFVEQAPDSATLDAWRRWVHSSSECSAAYARACEAWDVLGNHDDTPWLAAMAAEAGAAMMRRHSQRRVHASRRLLFAACVALALIVGGVGWWYAVAPVTYVAGVGERRTVQLKDGSQISLDADTRIEVDYTGDHRRLRLVHGRVACEVAKDPLRPFSVRAADKVIVATGTKFSVELVADLVNVVLYNGHVAILVADGALSQPQPVRLRGADSPADVKLVPGRELTVPVDEGTAVVTAVDPRQSLSWEHWQLYFDNQPLALAVERVNRYSHARIAVGDAAAARIRISGVFTAGSTDAFINGVTKVFPLQVVDRDGVRTLISKSP